MSLLTEIVIGIYLGLLAGIIPALVAGILGFVFKYTTGVSIPALAVVVFAGALAGISGGLMGLLDEQVAQSARFVVALILVMMLSLYAHSQGDKLGAALPRRFSLRSLGRRTLSADVIQVAGGIGEATITASTVEDMEGYPPLSPELRSEIEAGSWTFRADVPIHELEVRLAERLTTEFDLTDVSATIDDRGRAKIVAAPPSSVLSRRVPDGKRAVSISALLPTGVAVGERVSIDLADRSIDATVVSARSDPSAASPALPPTPEVTDSAVEPDGGEVVDEAMPGSARAPTTGGGEGRITVAVSRSEASALLAADRGRVIVRSRGTRREFELVAVLRRAGKRFEKVTIKAGSPLEGETIGSASIRDTHGVAVLAIKHPALDPRKHGGRSWVFSPGARTSLSAGDELFVVGRRERLDSFAGIARGGERP